MRLGGARCLVAALALAAFAQPPAAALPSGAPATARSGEFAVKGQFTQGGWMRGIAPAGTVALMLDGKAIAMSPDGDFFAAFDRDSPAGAELIARRADGREVRRSLSIAPRAWQIERINAPFRPPSIPSAEFTRIRAGELAQIAAARGRATGSSGWRQDFTWPLSGAVRGRFGAQRIYRGTPGTYHGGLDIAGAEGTPFTAPADGMVVLAAASPFTLEGRLLIVDHGMGLTSAFLHCANLAVKEGDAVRQGQLLGWVGKTGRATGPHLHWALKWNEARLDPLLFVPSAR